MIMKGGQVLSSSIFLLVLSGVRDVSCFVPFLKDNAGFHCTGESSKPKCLFALDYGTSGKEIDESSDDGISSRSKDPLTFGNTKQADEVFHAEEENWLKKVVEEIHNEFQTLDGRPQEDNGSVVVDSVMDDEIAMLVRCNEEPSTLLITEGRALGPLTKDERNDVSQLVVYIDGVFKPTSFFRNAVSEMFLQHAVSSPFDGTMSMDKASVASWMTKALREEGEGKVSQHDKRVLQTLSEFSTYGTGRLVEADFQNLYLRCIVGDESNLSSVSVKRHLELRKPFRDAVWRDIRAHGILSPVEVERSLLVQELNNPPGRRGGTMHADQMFIDECEILDWDYRAPEATVSNKRNSTRGSSSHKLVEMTHDMKTSLRMKDGEFVFIDEESCIGCMQCVNIAPSAFTMMESGRARTYCQRNSIDVMEAVNACPVSCMHRVSYHELHDYELARDEGQDSVGWNGKGYIPLHVAGIDSDVNRRTSLYHSLRAKCVTSSKCPQNGCFDCPSYRNPGDNPYFIANQKTAQHARAQHFIKNGDADIFRKTADL